MLEIDLKSTATAKYRIDDENTLILLDSDVLKSKFLAHTAPGSDKKCCLDYISNLRFRP